MYYQLIDHLPVDLQAQYVDPQIRPPQDAYAGDPTYHQLLSRTLEVIRVTCDSMVDSQIVQHGMPSY
jgi:hypothetical protein